MNVEMMQEIADARREKIYSEIRIDRPYTEEQKDELLFCTRWRRVDATDRKAIAEAHLAGYSAAAISTGFELALEIVEEELNANPTSGREGNRRSEE